MITVNNNNSWISKIIGKTAHATIVKTFALEMNGADFRIDHKPRRKNQSIHRRAIVHNQSDGLTINWARDYPGGVTIHGDVQIPDKLIIKKQDISASIGKLEKRIQHLEQIFNMIDWEASEIS